MTHRRAVWVLVGCTLIWGASFSLIKAAQEFGAPLAVLGLRLTVASLLLVRVFPRTDRSDWVAGIKLGALFWVQLALMNTGLLLTTASRSAFLIGLAVPIVPVVQYLFTRERPRTIQIFAILLALAGTGLVTQPGSGPGGVLKGDVLTFFAAIAGAVYIVRVGELSRHHEAIRLLAVQLVTMATLSWIAVPFLGPAHLQFTPQSVWLFGLLALSSIATFGGQLEAQRFIPAAEAVVVFALEPVVATVIGYLTLGDRLTPIQWFGGCLIVAATWSVAPRTPTPPAVTT